MTVSIEYCNGILRTTVNLLTPPGEKGTPWERLSVMSKIKTKENWYTLCAGMDLLEDTESAKDNFRQFGLDGPTKYENIGEKYLRLYGILNASYQQQEAILSLLQFTNVADMKKERQQFDALEIMKIRSIAGSHAMNYKNYNSQKKQEKQSYMIARYSLDRSCISFRNSGGTEEINIKESIEEFDKIVTEKLFEIIHCFVDILKKNKPESYEENRFQFEQMSKIMHGEPYSIKIGELEISGLGGPTDESMIEVYNKTDEK
jgi:hypothetical protein